MQTRLQSNSGQEFLVGQLRGVREKSWGISKAAFLSFGVGSILGWYLHVVGGCPGIVGYLAASCLYLPNASSTSQL